MPINLFAGGKKYKREEGKGYKIYNWKKNQFIFYLTQSWGERTTSQKQKGKEVHKEKKGCFNRPPAVRRRQADGGKKSQTEGGNLKKRDGSFIQPKRTAPGNTVAKGYRGTGSLGGRGGPDSGEGDGKAG